FTPSLAVGPRLVHERLGVPRGAPALGTTPTRRQPTVWVMKRCRKSGCSLWIRLACDLAQNNGETGIIGARPFVTKTHRIELLTQCIVPAATSLTVPQWTTTNSEHVGARLRRSSKDECVTD